MATISHADGDLQDSLLLVAHLVQRPQGHEQDPDQQQDVMNFHAFS
jgi:hypothetical protein